MRKENRKTRKGKSNTKCFQRTNDGMTCSKCNSFVCIECLLLATHLLKQDKHLFVDQTYVNNIDTIVSDYGKKNYKSPSNCIGQCCLIEQDTPIKDTTSIKPNKITNIDTPILSGCISFI